MKLLILLALTATSLADVSHLLGKRPPAPAAAAGPDAAAPILRLEADMGEGGAYSWAFETGNGISARAQGELKDAGTEQEAQVVQGAASWTAPGGEPVQLTYIADENGYQPQGSHLPTPPPIPAAILRALEWIAAHPQPASEEN